MTDSNTSITLTHSVDALPATDSPPHQSHHRPYTFLELTNSLCTQCLHKVEAKIIQEEDRIYLLKHCLTHGTEKVLISTDAEYTHRARTFLKPGQVPLRFNTQTVRGCPYDCGLCPDHEQHSCLTLIEITQRCNLTCPICYADSSPTSGDHLDLATIERMLDTLVANEGQPDVVQLSGGEPTIHPQFFEILDLARTKPIRHLMVNTNGVRIAQDKAFAERLATYMPGFEIYLQFDSLKPNPLKKIRGQDLLHIRHQALEHLNALNLSTTLVVVVEKGVNDDEIGDILDFAQRQPCVRGVTFQPVQRAGRTDDFDPAQHRLTLTEVRQQILSQSNLFSPEDILPVPCHPDCIAMAYAFKEPSNTPDSTPTLTPLSRFMDPDLLLNAGGNTIRYEADPAIREHFFGLFALNHSPTSSSHAIHDLLCCLPQIEAPNLGYENLFRVIIMEFLDPWNFDVRSVKRSCVHIAHPHSERIIPFDTYNLFYRPGLSLPEGIKTGSLSERVI